MSQSTTLTIRLEPELKARLDKLAAVTQRSGSYLAGEAVREYVELNEWRIQELTSAVKEADEGDFAGDKEVAAVFNKWEVDAASSRDGACGIQELDFISTSYRLDHGAPKAGKSAEKSKPSQ